MPRLRLYDLRLSRLPGLIGLCQANVPEIADAVNSAQRRLLFCNEAGDEGWYGTWAEILFYVSQTTPTITLPREVARLESVNVCNLPASVNNQFYEYLQFGNGRMPKCRSQCGAPLSGYTRNNAVTFTDLTNGPQYLTAYISNDQDIGRRIFFGGRDNNDNTVYTQDNSNRVSGEFLTLETPFASTDTLWNTITGIQKDITAGPVSIYQTDPTTGAEILLLTMEPGETTASYRRYYFNPLPRSCCSSATSTTAIQSIPVTAIAKLEMIPVKVDTDYLLIQDMEAIINECQSLRMSQMDTETAQKMSLKFHQDAVRSLNGQLTHYLGSQQAAINIAPFGSARLERQMIGRLM